MKPESNRVEYKRQLSDKFERSVVAFLNSSGGGRIYIGVDDAGNRAGVANADAVQKEIVDRVKNNILPSTLGLFDVAVEEQKGKSIVCVIISEGGEKPYHLKKFGMSPSGCFVRVGSTVQSMTTAMIDDLFQKRNRLTLGRLVAPRGGLTFEQLQIYYNEHGIKLPPKSFKRSLELLTEDGKDNYVAYLLADENAVSIKVAKYAGTDKVNLIENAEYGYCCLIKATQRVLDKLLVENKTFAKITPTVRLERNMVDKFALREAFINAIVHNDYTSGVTPLVEIFSDRMVITSYGGLPDGLSREDFFACCSKPRNRELMRVFRDMDLVEQIGSGMSRILAAYDRSIFKFTPNFMVVTFPVEMADETQVDGNDTKDEPINEPINEPIKTMEEELLALIRENPRMSKETLACQIGRSRASITRIIKDLVSYGKIKRVGSNKNGHWEFVDTESGKKDDIKDGKKDDSKKPLEEVLSILRGHPSITLDEIASQLNVSNRTASRTIKTLVEAKRISRVGGRRFGHWVVTDE